MGVGEDKTIFLSLFFLSLYVGVASCWICSDIKALHIGQSFLRTQLSSPTPLSRHHALFKWPSNIAITWPQVPLFCPGDDMMISTSVEIRRCEIKWMNSQINFKTSLCRKHVRTLTPNDAMMSHCLDRKYDAPSSECILRYRSCQCYIQDVFFWRLAGPVAPTSKAIVHWIGCINAIKMMFVKI